jgi:predicted dehydrogenase
VLKGGVIGFGNIGQQLTHHVGEAWQGRARIVAACNRGPENLAVARDRFGLAVTHDPAELFAMGLDFVLVTSTSAAHAAQVEAAAERGLAVFCEKPIALTLEDADRAIAAVERAGVVTVVNYSLRFIDAYRTIRELARSGELGRILAVHHLRTRGYGLHEAGARHRAVVEARESGGWTVHHACHDIDFLYWVHGPIARAYARTATTVPGGASEELVLALVDFADGAVGSIGDSVCRIREHATLVVGSRASLAMSGEAGATVLRLHREGSDRPEIIPVRDEKRPGGGLDHFLECVLAGTPSPDSLASARHSLAVALAMRESARTGRPVDVPPENPPAGP